jgi:hypothetical protein
VPGRPAGVLIALACAAGLVAGASSAPALASPAHAAARAPHVTKPVPARPPAAPNVGLGQTIPPKPHRAHGTVRPMITWTVAISFSNQNPWPTQYSTVTATANQDVGPTPYYIRIHDDTAGAYIATCSSGTTCSVAVTQPAPTMHLYSVWIADSSAAFPPGNVQAVVEPDPSAVFSPYYINWKAEPVSLSPSANTVPVGGTTTLTATTPDDIGPSPFCTEIFDVTTGAELGEWGSGTSWSVQVSQSAATTHEYVATVATCGIFSYPPPNIDSQTEESYVTWSDLGWQVSLVADGNPFAGPLIIHAEANRDVGPTPYYIQIFNEDTGLRLASCASGSDCPLNFTSAPIGLYHLVAFVSASSSTFPPTGIVASSNLLTVDQP